MKASAKKAVEHVRDRRGSSRGGRRDRRGRSRNVLFASVSSGALGSAAVGLFFVAIDSFRGDPFFTPSLMGTVVFLRIPAAEVASVRVDMMALYTIVHILSFVALGAAFTLLYQRVDSRSKHPVVLAVMIFFALGAGMFVADAVIFPGIARAIGPLLVLGANALAAAVMAWFIHTSLTEEDPHLPEFSSEVI